MKTSLIKTLLSGYHFCNDGSLAIKTKDCKYTNVIVEFVGNDFVVIKAGNTEIALNVKSIIELRFSSIKKVELFSWD